MNGWNYAAAGIAGTCLAAMGARAVLANQLDTPKLCTVCTERSRNHPTGPLHRYTRRRVNNRPVCRRHRRQKDVDLV